MMQEFLKKLHITTSTTTNVVNKSVYLTRVLISMVDTGTSWTVGIADKGTPVSYVIPPVLPEKTVDAAGRAWAPEQPILMEGGIDVITATGGGGTPGNANIWIWYKAQPD